ncbi:3-deoxy-8-phosphooctulonate synthase [Alkalihalobacillus pseudalcaliphilus]|uniref:3-deoxy-8-phosphooctulonate synthase n=1 Tax=Alkalihalobacillus pseudalcaliphilus TaxID=79884 RepID=UPI00064DE39E|nr:3-deoxy-8-phosphooctulonate synthase [Alkalihalobacillus pseudalcaliphilus]KMK77391.1 2-dehydro-3-deoxyphosphooctonate aldolase [Alkalihalobacillus pseudalcaliphilus]
MPNLVRLNDEMIFGEKNPFVLMAGPCVIESRELVFETAEKLKEITDRLQIPFIFKASFDKANRSSIHSSRGPGIEQGLEILSEVKEQFQVPVTSDVHEPYQVEMAADVLDIIQIPAFLCRQTDLLVAAARTGKIVNVKKGQFLAPWDMTNVVNKLRESGGDRILLTERGTTFGYNNLVVDMRSLITMNELGVPVVFDATHSVQIPGGNGTTTGGKREFVPYLSRAAAAVGVSSLFIETHPNPDLAESDGPNMVKLNELEEVLKPILDIDRLVKQI